MTKAGLKCCFRNYKEVDKMRTRKLRSAKCFRSTSRVHFTSQSVKFWSNQSGNKVKLIKLTRSQQSCPFVFRSTLAFCERFKNDMRINGRVVK